MPLTPGARLGPYEIISPLGVGGMGEVYRARDTKLNREVAIKVLPAAFAQDAERMARFQREAQMLAALNHPNIAQIFGLEVGTESPALIMELVPGETLQGPLPVNEALAIARQIAEALEYAHDRGIIHRDLKPANIKVTRDGIVKVLDFGLAKALDDSPSSQDISNSPTMSLAGTKAGLILGTAAYMSPEQARGKPADRRSDIFSYGIVLLEMLTGRKAFEGEMLSDVLAAVIRDQPAIPPDLPPNISKLLRRCLEKDPRRRLQAIGEARIALEQDSTEQIAASSATGPSATGIPKRLRPWILAGILTGALLLVTTIVSLAGWRAARQSSTPAGTGATQLMRFDAVLAPDALSGTNNSAAYATISPDGTRVLYTAGGAGGQPMLLSRRMDQQTGNVIAGTENGFEPFFSPDGQRIGFFADGKLKVVSASGGAAVIVAEVMNPRGASWGDDGTIVAPLTNTSGLSRIPAGGGPAQRLTQLRPGEATHRWPQFLPGGQAVLFTACDNLSNYENASIEMVNVKTGERTTLHRGGFFGRYVESGHLLYVQKGVLFALALGDLKNGSFAKSQAPPVPILDDVASLANSGAGQFDVSRTGVLVYHSGKATAEVWGIGTFDAAGTPQVHPQLSRLAGYFTPRFSPDGRRLAVALEAKGMDIYVYDTSNDVLSRLTFTSQLTYQPVWTPDGAHIVFRNTIGNVNSLSWIRSDGAGGAQDLVTGKAISIPNSFSPSGTILAFGQRTELRWEVWTMSLDLTDPEHPKTGKPEPFSQGSANELHPAFSPDGRWMAYTSDESGAFEVYVRPFPATAGGGKWQISTGGGRMPVWARKGSDLFFESLDNRIMVVGYSVKDNSFIASKPRRWSEKLLVYTPTTDPNYDVAPDGTRVVSLISAASPEESKGPVHATFLLNFFDELRRKVPGKQ